MRIWPLALAVGLLPLLGVTASYALSDFEGHISSCNPFFEGCTTISATGRHGTAFYAFKAFLLPSAVLFALYWLLVAHWLGLTGRHRRSRAGLGVLGVVAAACLVLYTTFLGSDGALFAIYRRIGASSFFSGTFFCQLLLVAALAREPGRVSRPVLKLLWGLVLAQLALGLISLPVTSLLVDPAKDLWENRIEWLFGLCMILFFPVWAWVWRGDRLQFAAAAR